MIDEIPEEWKRAYLALGLLAANWASVEFALDHMINTVHVQFDGDKIEPERPRSFNRKPTYLRKAFAAHEGLAPHLPDLDRLLNEASNIAEQRHWCLHGFLDLRNRSGPFSVIKVVHKGSPRTELRSFSVESMTTLAERALALSVNLLFFGVSTIWVEGQDDLNQVIREFLGKDRTALPSD